MRTAEEYFNAELERVVFGTGKLENIKLDSDLSRAIIRNAIKQAQKEAIEECAERAKIVRYQPNPFADMSSALANTQADYIDKQSILSLINELK